MVKGHSRTRVYFEQEDFEQLVGRGHRLVSFGKKSYYTNYDSWSIRTRSRQRAGGVVFCNGMLPSLAGRQFPLLFLLVPKVRDVYIFGAGLLAH